MKKIFLGTIILFIAGCSGVGGRSEKKITLPTISSGNDSSYTNKIEYIEEKDILSNRINTTFGEMPRDERIEAIKDRVLQFELQEENITDKIIKEKLAYLKDSAVPFTGRFLITDGYNRYYSEEYENGKLQGNKVWYSQAGAVGMIEPYTNGLKNGMQETYYRDTADIRSKIEYSRGKLSGLIAWYDKNGNILFEEKIVNGTGKWAKYWDNGNIREKGNYVNWRKNGLWSNYDKEGNLEKNTKYENGLIKSREWLK